MTFSDSVIEEFSLGEEKNGMREILSPNPIMVRSVINSFYGHLGTFDETIEDIDEGRKKHIIERTYKFSDCSSLVTRQEFEKAIYIPGKGYNAIVNEKAFVKINN